MWTYLDSLPLSPRAGAAAHKAPGAYIQGGTELSGFGPRTGGAAFSQTQVLAEAMLSLLSPPAAGAERHSESHQPDNHCSPSPGDSLRPNACTGGNQLIFLSLPASLEKNQGKQFLK